MSKLHEIALTFVPNIGHVTGRLLVETFGSAEAVFNATQKQLHCIQGLRKDTFFLLKNKDAFLKAEQELKFIEKSNIQTLFYTNDTYPQRLKHCADAPLVLYFRGNADLNEIKVINIVGTRHMTDYGKECISHLIQELKDEQLLIVSGLAYGVDTHAHRVALDCGFSTVGVLAHGLDTIYPSQNKKLAEQMLEQGGLLTEYCSQTKPDAPHFPSRNRIVAGMCDATIVIESAAKGGALITAELANSYNRDVFAFPGRIGDPYSAGCNKLIKINKAALIENADDLRYLLGWDRREVQTNVQRQLFVELPQEQREVWDCIAQNDEIEIDLLCAKTGFPLSKVASALLSLELQGLINTLPGKRYKII